MRVMYDADPPQFAEGGRALRNAMHAVYALYAASFLFGVTALAGVIIAYLKRRDAAGTIYASHVDWTIRTFWIAFLGVIVGTILSLIVIGVPILFLVGIWAIYRTVKGWVRLAEERPIENPHAFF
ncbi:MAG TPA: hypothetical protein VFO41_04150 [Alphaproteobacteria bacterium]|nr:hypothetical protein [Alphaproteobacteria bacterium]